MGLSHHAGLFAGYALAAVAMLIIAAKRPKTWPAQPRIEFARPWLDFGLAIVACAGVLLVGRMWSAGWLLPETNDLFKIVNQVAIFAPMGALLLIRRQGSKTAYLPGARIPERLGVGLLLAIAALAAYALVTRPPGHIGRVFAETYAPDRLHHIVQVFLEDATIAIVLCRLAAAVKRPWIAVAAVATLFAAGHIPQMISEGAAAADLLRLALDVGLGALVLTAILRVQDVWWFWPVHATLDLSQFVGA